MVLIKKVSGKEISDSREDKTIEVVIETDVGKFSASSPTGKSTGKHEARSYKKSLEGDIESLPKFSEYFSEDKFEEFGDLKLIEDVLDGHVGANTFFAFESAILKAMAKEQGKEIWEIVNIDGKREKFPRFVGNCIGGGKHSETEKKPDFQEFLIIPKESSPRRGYEIMKEVKEDAEILLGQKDRAFSGRKNDENAWITSLTDKEVFDLLNKLKEKFEIESGTDIAASGFYKRKKYQYKNPLLKRSPEEQLDYLSNIIKNLGVYYIEDPFNEEDFESFSKLKKKFPKRLIVGDDLTTTNPKRLKKAIKEGSINAIIVKPNQIGSLLDVSEVCEIAKDNNIKTIFSHRSGETKEDIIADLAFGFQADFLKCGITGKGREEKIKRLIEIEEKLKSN